MIRAAGRAFGVGWLDTAHPAGQASPRQCGVKPPQFNILALFFPFILLTTPAFTQDVIHLRSGENIVGRLDAVTDNIVNFTLPNAPIVPGGSARRTIPMEQVEYLEFAFQPGESAVFERRDSLGVSDLQPRWDATFANLHRPRSRAGAWGVALARALLREGGLGAPERALDLSDRIIARAWSPDDVAAGRQARLQCLIAIGDLGQATREAQQLAQETEEPGLLIEVKYLLAQADFAALKALELEHPRWIEDDEILPQREELYHRTIDQLLWPHLFHATRSEVAARGLAAAAKVYDYAGEATLAGHARTDLVRLYPTTSAAQALTSPNPSDPQNP